MRKLFRTMVPHWKMLILIVLLLIVQVFCDLALPTYTADILDVGIQNQGVEHILPEKITDEDHAYAKMFMTEEEQSEWDAAYVQEGEIYTRVNMEEEVLDQLDESLIIPIMLNYQVSTMDEETLMGYMAQAEAAGQQMDLMEVRGMLEETVDTMGASMMKSTGIAYAIQCHETAGVDGEQIQKNYLWHTGLIMLGFTGVSVACAIVVSFFASRIGGKIGRDMRGNVFKRVLGFSNTEMSRFSTASLITRTTNDVQLVQMVVTMLIRMAFYAPIMAIGGVIMVIGTKANMGWVIVLAVIVIMSFVFSLVMVVMPKFKIMQKLVDRVNLVAREILTGIPVIRAFKREEREEERFDGANMDLTKTQLFTNRVMSCMMPGMMVLMNCTVVLITWVAAGRIDGGTMQVGAMTAFITYAMQIIMSFLVLTMMAIMIPRAGVAAERIDEVLQTESSITDPVECKQIPEKKGVVQFDHVCFRFDNGEEDALTDISFTAEPGKTTAIIGSTGSGKSTLAHLIPRLYDVTGGSISLDGVDIRELSLEALRGSIGFVPQKGVLFSGTIASNLRFGNAKATDAEIIQAAEIAQATEFIDAKTDKYDSEIAQGGTNVSGGQKQRLAIARAIAKNPLVYVFDDSFSALDMKTDVALRRALADKVADKTMIIVAQRISTILHADQILVLEDGRLVGKGTHRELLESCDVYLQIARSQLSEKELNRELGKEEA